MSMNERLKTAFQQVKRRVAKKPYLWVTIAIFLGLIIIPVCIWVAFFVGDNGFVIIHTSLEVGDALGFYGSILAFISTGVLGLIAVMQNNRLQKLEEDVATRNNSCNIYIEYHDGYATNITKKLSNESLNPYPESTSYFNITIQNYSEPFLKKISIQFGDNTFCSHITLVKGLAKNVKIFLPQGFDVQALPTCKITFTSCYNVDTYGDFQLVVKQNPHIPEIRYYHFYGTNDVQK